MSISVNKSLQIAKRHAKRGEVAEAIGAYKAVLEQFPNNKRAIEGLRAVSGPNASSSNNQNLRPSQNQVNGLISLFDTGKLEGAINQGKAFAQQYPNEPFFPNFLGVVNFELGNFEVAIQCYNQAVQINPGFDEAYNNMGLAHTELEKFEDASECFYKATQINPAYAVAHNNLGNALKELDNNEAAITSYNNAIHNNPYYDEALVNLGVLLTEKKNAKEAENCFAKAIQINPDNFDAYFNQGIFYLELDCTQQAIDSFNKSTLIKPDHTETHINLGNAHRTLNNYEAALDSYAHALQINPEYAEVYYNTAITHESQGNKDEAIRNLKKAIQINPGYAEAHRVLSFIGKYKLDDPRIMQMSDLIQQQNLSAEDRMHLSFAYGKALGDIKKYDSAFLHLSEGNRIRKEKLKYKPSSDWEKVDKLKSIFTNNTPTLSNSYITKQSKQKNPIFILGMFRSGSSLTEQIIASHSMVHGAGELSLFEETLNSVDWSQQKISVKTLESIRISYVSGLEDIGFSEPYVTDKLPNNFWWIGYILSAFPEAKIIHTIRDPRAICWSIFKHYFPAEPTGFAFNLKDIANYYNLYRDLMAFWHEKFPGQIYDMNYEALTNDQEGESHKLIDFIGLDWEENCLEFHKNKRIVQTASSQQVRQKIYTGSSDEWQNYEKHLGPMLEILESV